MQCSSLKVHPQGADQNPSEWVEFPVSLPPPATYTCQGPPSGDCDSGGEDVAWGSTCFKPDPEVLAPDEEPPSRLTPSFTNEDIEVM